MKLYFKVFGWISVATTPLILNAVIFAEDRAFVPLLFLWCFVFGMDAGRRLFPRSRRVVELPPAAGAYRTPGDLPDQTPWSRCPVCDATWIERHAHTVLDACDHVLFRGGRR